MRVLLGVRWCGHSQPLQQQGVDRDEEARSRHRQAALSGRKRSPRDGSNTPATMGSEMGL